MCTRLLASTSCTVITLILLCLKAASPIPITRAELPIGQHCCPVNESLLWRKTIHGLSANATKQLEPFLNYQFLLPELEVMAGLKYPSSGKRLRKFVSELMNATRPLKVGVVGGSISWGTGATMRGERDWFSLFMSWLASVSSYPVTGRNGCIPGTPSHYMVLCLEHSVDVDLDLVLVEYVFNDGLDDCDCIRNNGVVKSVEQLLRKLMDLPSRPAVVMVQVPHVRSKDFDPFFRTSEDLEGALAAYYDIPTVSLRDALYPLNVHRPTEGFLWNQTYNEHHPGDAGHKALADIVVHLIQETALGLLSYPPSREEAAKLERPLLPPMYTGNLPPSTSVCLVGHTFTSLVTYAQGWSWVNEGTEEKPKWGYVATEPGSRLVVRLPDTLPPGGRHAAAAAVPVLLHYLQSYAGMGKARVECGGGGCNCSTVVVDALHLGRSSQTYMALVMVEGLGLMAGEGEAGTKREGDDGAAAPAGCELSVTVLEETSSILDGGHKFKISGVVVAHGYKSSALESVHRWHIPGDD